MRRAAGACAAVAIVGGLTPFHGYARAAAKLPTAGAWTIGRPVEGAKPPAPSTATAPSAASPGPRQVIDPTVTTVRLRPTDLTAADGSVVVQELEITSHAPGPAVWRVTRGDSEVVVIGGLTPLPHQLVWDQRRVVAALDGAKALLLPPQPRLGVLESVKLVFQAGALRLPGSAPLERRLPEPTRSKFLEAIRIAHASPDRYAKRPPWAAAVLLIADFRRAAGLSEAKPGSTIERLARAAKVPVRYTGRLGAASLIDGLAALAPERQTACVDAAADDVIWEAGHAVTAAQAWAHGHLAQVRANWSTGVLDRCLLESPRVQQALERGTAEATAAISDALGRPGRTVAVVDLHFLLRANGLLDQLRAGGDQVSTPPG